MCKLHPLHNRIFVLILLGTLPIFAQDLDSQLQKREVVAYYTNSPIVLDGVLDEPAWAGAEPATDFIQRPLSDIFIVYNEDRGTFQTGETDKSLTLKYTHMFDLF